MSKRKNLFLQDSDQVLIIFSKVFGIVALSTLTLHKLLSAALASLADSIGI